MSLIMLPVHVQLIVDELFMNTDSPPSRSLLESCLKRDRILSTVCRFKSRGSGAFVVKRSIRVHGVCTRRPCRSSLHPAIRAQVIPRRTPLQQALRACSCSRVCAHHEGVCNADELHYFGAQALQLSAAEVEDIKQSQQGLLSGVVRAFRPW